MKLGFIILAHEHLERVSQLANHLTEQGCVVCIHIDKTTNNSAFDQLSAELAANPDVRFTRRTACEWGRFSIVKATLDAAGTLLDAYPDTSHVCLISGSCLPVRPLRQFHKFLQRNESTDYIESVSVQNNIWVKGGLNEERFTLYFPFSWRNQRWLFDKSVELQRNMQVKRKLPQGLVPHIGSQWWCLTAKTLRKILDDPRRPHYDAYFQKSWIPDESYFQTLARLHSKRIESRSLTFSKFDFQGRPYLFYDDHLDLLSKTDCFMARKIWYGSEKLYSVLLDAKRANQPMTKSNPKVISAVFETADVTRCEGGEGRFHTGRFPQGHAARAGVSAGEYTVFVGFRYLYSHFPEWLEKNTAAKAHGRLFAPRRVGNQNPDTCYPGNLPAEPVIRNRNTRCYLSNYLWAYKGQHQTFLYEIKDNKEVAGIISYDQKARVVMIRHSWLLMLLNQTDSFGKILASAQKFQKLEQEFINAMAEGGKEQQFELIELDSAVQNTAETLLTATSHLVSPEWKRLQILPKMHNLEKLDSLVRKLRNKGLSIRYEQAHKPNNSGQPNKADYTKPYVVK